MDKPRPPKRMWWHGAYLAWGLGIGPCTFKSSAERLLNKLVARRHLFYYFIPRFPSSFSHIILPFPLSGASSIRNPASKKKKRRNLAKGGIRFYGTHTRPPFWNSLSYKCTWWDPPSRGRRPARDWSSTLGPRTDDYFQELWASKAFLALSKSFD